MGWWSLRAEIWILGLGYIFRYKININKFSWGKYYGGLPLVLSCQSPAVGRQTDYYSLFFKGYSDLISGYWPWRGLPLTLRGNQSWLKTAAINEDLGSLFIYQSQVAAPPVPLEWGRNCSNANLNAGGRQRHNIWKLYRVVGHCLLTAYFLCPK